MTPKVIRVLPIKPANLLLTYETGEVKLFDVLPYMISEFFGELKEWEYFSRVYIRNGTVEWPNEQDIAPETLYVEGKKFSND